MASGRVGLGSGWLAIQESKRASCSGRSLVITGVPAPIAGRPIDFLIPRLDTINIWYHKVRGGGSLHLPDRP